MTKLNRTQIIVLNVALLFLGLGIVAYGSALSSNPSLTFWGGLLNAFGIALAVSGSVTLLDRVLVEKPKPTGTERSSMMRKSMPRAIHDLKETATKVDILGISLTDFFNEVVHDREQGLVKNILRKPGERVRVMFEHPEAPYLRQRSFEDGDHSMTDLLNRQYASVERCIQMYNSLQSYYQDEKKKDASFEPRGTLIIKLIEACPYISYERYDFNIYWGLYTSDSPGKSAPVYLTNYQDNEMYEKLKAHFMALLQKGYEEVTRSKDRKADSHNVLLTVTDKGPWLNEPLAVSLLGAKRTSELLKRGVRPTRKQV